MPLKAAQHREIQFPTLFPQTRKRVSPERYKLLLEGTGAKPNELMIFFFKEVLHTSGKGPIIQLLPSLPLPLPEVSWWHLQEGQDRFFLCCFYAPSPSCLPDSPAAAAASFPPLSSPPPSCRRRRHPSWPIPADSFTHPPGPHGGGIALARSRTPCKFTCRRAERAEVVCSGLTGAPRAGRVPALRPAPRATKARDAGRDTHVTT